MIYGYKIKNQFKIIFISNQIAASFHVIFINCNLYFVYPLKIMLKILIVNIKEKTLNN